MNISDNDIAKLPPIVKKLFLRWRHFLYKNVRFNREQSKIHGKEHCERVLLYGLLIGEKIWGDNEERLNQIAEAAVFHDSRRLDEYLDTGHGARAAVYYQEYCRENPQFKCYPEVAYMMRYHDLDDKLGIKAIKKAFGDKAGDVLTQYAIFKDADALDRWRLGHNGLDKKFLRTEAAVALVDYARRIVADTMDPHVLKEVERHVDRTLRLLKQPRALIIVDPQYDFITGTLPVPGAEKAMNRLADFLKENPRRFSVIIVTADRHPYRHCSFREEGGPWPRHCVHDTEGAAVWQPLFAPIYDSGAEAEFLYKGQKEDVEEYSIFQNPDASQRIRELIEKSGIGIITICGLAGDVCVKATAEDAVRIFGADRISIDERFSPSIDGGKGY